jgi:hypothetical protein
MSRANLDGLAFFEPASPDELAAALAWTDAHSKGDAEHVWGYDGDPEAWSVLRLPSPRIHPRAAEMFAVAAGVPASAIAAVLAGHAFVDDDGVLRLWPWYPEEEAATRPIAERQAAELGVALPRAHLDQPFEPAHYVARASMAALERWLAARGVDASRARVDRVPMPPRNAFAMECYEGGMHAPTPGRQALARLAYTTSLFDYIREGDEGATRVQFEARLDRDLAIACARIGGGAMPARAAEEAEPVVVPEIETAPIGRVQGLLALRGRALLVTEGALVAIDREGRFAGAWPKPLGNIFARGELAIVNYSHALDVVRGTWLTGDLAELVARMGLEALPSTSGHDERTAPVISACGRYLLDVDESPYTVRLEDDLTVADHRELEEVLATGAEHDDTEDVPATPEPGPGLVAAEQIRVAQEFLIDGVRFVVRAAASPVAAGRSLAFALAGDR